MKKLTIEPRDLEILGYQKITKEEAIGRVSAGNEIVAETGAREINLVNTLQDIELCISRKEMGIYERLNFYAETTKY